MSDYETKRVFAENLCKLLDKEGISQIEFARKMNVAASTVSSWCNGDKMPRMDKVEWMAEFFGVPRTSLIDDGLLHASPANIIPMPKMRKVPLVGTIACGTPILAEENIQEDVDIPEHIKADFALRCEGDSMINARIYDGDIVYIRQQDTIENGEIAAVLVDNEATLKRVKLFDDHVVLEPENPQYRPLVYWGEEMNQVHILGKAVAFTSGIR